MEVVWETWFPVPLSTVCKASQKPEKGLKLLLFRFKTIKGDSDWGDNPVIWFDWRKIYQIGRMGWNPALRRPLQSVWAQERGKKPRKKTRTSHCSFLNKRFSYFDSCAGVMSVDWHLCGQWSVLLSECLDIVFRAGFWMFRFDIPLSRRWSRKALQNPNWMRILLFPLRDVTGHCLALSSGTSGFLFLVQGD